MEKETEKYLIQLEKRIVLLEGRVALLEAQLSAMRPIPTYPSPLTPAPYLPYPQPYIGTPPRKCSKCGMNIEGVMGYVCNDSYCPTFPKVTYTTQNFGTVWASKDRQASNAYNEEVLAKNAKNMYHTDAKGTWAGMHTGPLEPHLNTVNIEGSTTSYAWDPISQGDKKI